MNTIQQTVDFPATPEQLFEIYMDSKKHSEATLAKATVSRKVGGKFTAFDGMLGGRNLIVAPNQLIVQAWRATHWKKTDPDSILVLKFSKTKSGGRVELLHANVPEYDFLGVKKGWPHYYWKPWRVYLKKNA
ncbi:MAG TPA: SRPBCC domain-containing protein [Terriglobia bacterium]|nr:SRPBCC domain-containing protein [Terriglobia bacterium]